MVSASIACAPLVVAMNTRLRRSHHLRRDTSTLESKGGPVYYAGGKISMP